MKIRIGNDVKLTLPLGGNDSGDLNILSAKAYISNRSIKEHALNEKRRINQFISRFPTKDFMIDPKLNGIEPDENNIHMLGEVPYHCYPKTYFVNNKQGFGIYPRWDKKYIPAIEEYSLTSYNAEVSFTNQRGVIEVTFPAEAQFFTGEYDVIVVAKIYQPGYVNNTKTITVDFSKCFKLVATNEEADVDDPTNPNDPTTIVEWHFGDLFPIILS